MSIHTSIVSSATVISTYQMDYWMLCGVKIGSISSVTRSAIMVMEREGDDNALHGMHLLNNHLTTSMGNRFMVLSSKTLFWFSNDQSMSVRQFKRKMDNHHLILKRISVPFPISDIHISYDPNDTDVYLCTFIRNTAPCLSASALKAVFKMKVFRGSTFR